MTAPKDAARPFPNEPTTPDELHQWLKDALDVHVPRTPVLPAHQAPFSYLCFSFFACLDQPQPIALIRNTAPHITDAIVWANRGGGKTFLGAIATLLDLLYRPEIEVRILAGSLEQSKRMYAHLRRFFDARRHPEIAAELEGKITERRIQMKNGASLELLAQSQTSVRGTRVQKLRCDEVDLFDPDVWDAAQLTTRSKQCGTHLVRGSVECLSTMHIPHGVMHRLVREAHEGARELFRWGVVDVLAHCGNDHHCRSTAQLSSPQTSNAQSQDLPAPLTISAPSTHDHPSNNNPAEPTPTPSPSSAQPELASQAEDASDLAQRCPLLPECQGKAKTRGEHAGHIPISDAITQKRRVPLAVWESEMLCLRPQRTNTVLPEFDPKKHVFEHAGPAPHAIAHWALGMDFGIRAPTAILWCAVGLDSTIWVMDERIIAGEILDEHINAIKQGLQREGIPAWPQPSFIAPDPAGISVNDQTGISPIKLLQQHGYQTRISRSEIQQGLSLVRARFAPATGESPRLYIHARCKTLIECLERYHYPKNLESIIPVKGDFDHAIDALRYLVQVLDKPAKTSSASYTT